MIRVYIIEDHPIIIFALKNLFRKYHDVLAVSGVAHSVQQALAEADLVCFDIIILDLWIGEEDPEKNVHALRQAFAGKPIVIFTVEEAGQWQRKMFAAGVTGYIFKTSDLSKIKSTLETVFKGGISFPGVKSPDDTNKLDGDFITQKKTISQLQREMVQMVYSGLKQREIARHKKISVSTVEKTLSNLREKFSAQNNSDLIRILTEKGLL
jgi:two-component system invasion response regulator UvrY